METVTLDAEKDRSLKTIGTISYALHLIVAVTAVLPGVQASILLLVVAFLIDMIKRDDARGTWHESHFTWRIRSVVWAAVLYVITIPLWLLFLVPGWIAWILISIWFLYRIIRGWLNQNDNKPIQLT
jgi:uncharacterized membrane protein